MSRAGSLARPIIQRWAVTIGGRRGEAKRSPKLGPDLVLFTGGKLAGSQLWIAPERELVQTLEAGDELVDQCRAIGLGPLHRNWFGSADQAPQSLYGSISFSPAMATPNGVSVCKMRIEF